jgi:transcription initiation factor TFIID subunit 7
MVDPRRAVVRIRRTLYGAKLVDLPTIIESSKTLDRKSLYKTADICQMLVVGDAISHEETILAYPSRPSDYAYPHGITPPLRWVRKRRFRKRISNRVFPASLSLTLDYRTS